MIYHDVPEATRESRRSRWLVQSVPMACGRVVAPLQREPHNCGLPQLTVVHPVVWDGFLLLLADRLDSSLGTGRRIE